jgi:hypothetical protein
MQIGDSMELYSTSWDEEAKITGVSAALEIKFVPPQI